MGFAREARVHLESDVSCLGEGRRFVARTLRDWDADAARIESVTLVANELVANAIVHAGSAPELLIAQAGTELVLRVADDSCAPPVVRPPTRDVWSGRGLLLVESLSDRWGVDIEPAGKSVWVAFENAFATAPEMKAAP
jgi:anti-sigma regulatory factor (Ser/Thr protein kinase)